MTHPGGVETMSSTMPEFIREVFSKATCIFSQPEVERALDKMAIDISHTLADTNPIFLCVVVGGIVPTGSLLHRLDFPLEVDYVHATRYNNTTQGSELTWKREPSIDMKGRTVLIIDDILDGGITMEGVVEFCKAQGADAVYTAVLVDKVDARLQGGLPKADFCGLEIENHYVFGYGLDYKGYLRNAPGIYMVAPEHE